MPLPVRRAAVAGALLCTALYALCSPVASQFTYRYDQRGRLIEATNPDGSLTSYQYDASGNLLSVSNPSGPIAPVNVAPLVGTTLAPAATETGALRGSVVAVVREVGGLSYHLKEAGVWRKSGATFAPGITGAPGMINRSGHGSYLFVPTSRGLTQYEMLSIQPLATFAPEAEPSARPTGVSVSRSDGNRLHLVVRLRDGSLGYYRTAPSTAENNSFVTWIGPVRFAGSVQGEPSLVAAGATLEVAVPSKSGQIQRYALPNGSLTWQRKP